MNRVRRPSRTAHRAILVLGMHRSGTSAVTRCLNLLGVDLGKHLLPPVEGNNPKGFWENTDVVSIHEELLGALGRAWHDTRALPKNWLTSSAALDARGRLAQLIRNEFGDSSLWAVKDPRLCRFLPLWADLLDELGIGASALLVVRHPGEVAASLKKRNDLPADAAYLSWLEHLSEAEAGSRGLPRSVISYEGLLSDWQRTLTRVARDLRVEWPVPMADAEDHIAAFLDSNERHHEIATAVSGMPEILNRLYHLLRARESGACDWKEISSLVDIVMLMTPASLESLAVSSGSLHPEANKGKSLEGTARSPAMDSGEAASGAASAQTSASSGLDYAAVYYRSGEQQYKDRRSRQTPFDWKRDEPLVQRFEVPAGTSMVRFDPSTRPGAFHLSEMQVNGNTVADLRARVRGANQYVLDRMGGDGVWFASNDEDPWVELGVSDLAAADEPLTIQMHCVRRPLESVLGVLLVSVWNNFQQHVHTSVTSSLAPVVDQLSGIRDGLLGRVETLQARGADLEQKLAVARERASAVEALQARGGELEQALAAAREHESKLQQTVDALQAHGAQLESKLVEQRESEATALREAFLLSAKLVKVQEQLDAANGRGADLEARRAELEAQNAESQSRIARLESELVAKGESETRALREAFWLSAKSVRAGEQLDSVQGRLAELEGRHAALAGQLRNQQAFNSTLQAELAGMKSSTLWRALARMRSVLLKVPRGPRLLLRRGMKMTWWVLTPWRMPARIRFMRARARAGRGSGG